MARQKYITINVSKEDIEKGRRNSPEKCPISRAVRREVKGTYVQTYHAYVRYSKKGSWWYLDLPDKASRFIEALDRGETVRPLNFKVRSE